MQVPPITRTEFSGANQSLFIKALAAAADAEVYAVKIDKISTINGKSSIQVCASVQAADKAKAGL